MDIASDITGELIRVAVMKATFYFKQTVSEQRICLPSVV